MACNLWLNILNFDLFISGIVQGVLCDRKQEDSIRIYIDNIIHQIDPPVLPHMYQVQFVPISDDSGEEAVENTLELK